MVKKYCFDSNLFSPNQKIENIHLLKRALFPYTTVGGAYMGKGEDKLPMILSGDFNVNFNTANSGELIDFLSADLNMLINKDPIVSTTRDGTTIDVVFVRYLGNIITRPFVSYFSYNK